MSMTIPLRRIHTLTNPCLLHHRLFSTLNSGGDHPNSPIQQPSPSASTSSSAPSFNDQTASFNSPSSETPSNASLTTFLRNYWGEQLQNKWKQFEANSESLKATYSGPDRKLSSEFNESRKALHDEILQNVSKFHRLVVDMDCRIFRQPRTQEILEYKASALITKTTDLEEKTWAGVKLIAILTNSRVAFLDEMIKNLSEIRKEWAFLKDLSSSRDNLGKGEEEEELNEDLLWNELNEELGNIRWDELHQALVGCQAMDLFDAKRLAVETEEQRAHLKEKLKLLHEMQDLIRKDRDDA